VDQAPGDGFLSATDTDLAVGVLGVPLDALAAHPQHVGDLAVGQAFGDAGQDLHLSEREANSAARSMVPTVNIEASQEPRGFSCPRGPTLDPTPAGDPRLRQASSCRARTHLHADERKGAAWFHSAVELEDVVDGGVCRWCSTIVAVASNFGSATRY